MDNKKQNYEFDIDELLKPKVFNDLKRMKKAISSQMMIVSKGSFAFPEGAGKLVSPHNRPGHLRRNWVYYSIAAVAFLGIYKYIDYRQNAIISSVKDVQVFPLELFYFSIICTKKNERWSPRTFGAIMWSNQ